jgi:outer membrane protein assembly factor BamB
LFAAGCGTSSRIAREEPAPLPEFTAERQVSELWSAGAGAGAGKQVLRLSPHLEADVLYTADRDGTVSALRAGDGQAIWTVELRAPVTSAAGVGAGLVMVGTKKGEVIALDRQDGTRRWSANVSSEVLGAPTAAENAVVVQTTDGKLTGLSAADGKRLWSYARNEPALSLRGTGTPVIAGGYVFAGFASGKIVALRLGDGRLAWELTVAEPSGRNEIERLVDVDAPVLLAGDTLYAAAYQGKVVAVDLKSGRTNWTRDASTHVSLAADARNLYIAEDGGRVVALDRNSGATVWKQEGLRGRHLNAPARIGDTVAVADFEGYVHWLAAEDGHFVARYPAGGGPIRAEAATGRDTLYVLNADGTVRALQLANR